MIPPSSEAGQQSCAALGAGLRRPSALAAVLALAAYGCAGAPAARDEGFGELAPWRAYLEGAPAAWRAIPWRPTFAEGLRDAARAERPLLLWGMNGHPLGAT